MDTRHLCTKLRNNFPSPKFLLLPENLGFWYRLLRPLRTRSGWGFEIASCSKTYLNMPCGRLNHNELEGLLCFHCSVSFRFRILLYQCLFSCPFANSGTVRSIFLRSPDGGVFLIVRGKDKDLGVAACNLDCTLLIGNHYDPNQ